MSKIALKKLIKKLGEIRGRHTELVSVYVPVGYSLNEIAATLKQEQSTAENIKSKHVRKNVTAALDKIIRHLALYKKTPGNGLAIFAGNVSEKEGAADIEIWAIEPPDPIETKLYWCDQTFVLEPLRDIVEDRIQYGIILLDRSEGDLGVLKGKKLEPLTHFESIVPGKTRAGGQCLLPDTLVQMSDGTIEEIDSVGNPHPVKTADFSSVSLKDTPVLNKWKSDKSPQYTITTKNPRIQITSSKDHLFFRWGDAVKEVPAESLQEGDYLLLPEKIDINGGIQSLKNEDLYNSYKIRPKGRKSIKDRRKSMGLLQKELARKAKVTQTAISTVELGKRNIKTGFLRRLCKALDIDPDSFIRRFCEPDSEITLPDTLDEKLAEFIGYFAGDGSVERERISLHDAEKHVIECYSGLSRDVLSCNTSITYRKNKGHYVARIYGKPIINLFKREFPELKKSRNMRIPRKILMSPDSVLAAFFRGFFDAEGYVTAPRGIGLGINNKQMAQQIQIALLRFGILASVVKYDNRGNPYSNNPRFTISITEGKSLDIFSKKISFNSLRKREKLEKVAKKKSRTSYVRQVYATGKVVRKIIESHGCKVSDFPRVSSFFRNERLMSKGAFKRSILREIRENKPLHDNLKAVLEYGLTPVKIKSIKTKAAVSRMIDIEVKNSNFIANGLVVHNSAARFSRVREGMLNDWLKQMGDAANKTFGDMDLKGIIVSGPGPIKEDFVKEDYLHNRLKKKIIGTVNTSYTGEQGLEETVERGIDLIEEQEIKDEKELLQKFFTELQKPKGHAVYGLDEVMRALKFGAVDTVILTEGLEKKITEYEHEGRVVVTAEGRQKGKKLGEEEIDVYLEEKSGEFGSDIVLVSRHTREGKQFFHMGGIGAILRFRYK